MMSRSKKAFLNMTSQLLLQAVTAICGFIVPKVMLESFGSEVNGLVTSISQFLGIITLMESGFGGVAKAAFYKPLAAKDTDAVSGVYNATESFFHKVAFCFLAYCVIISLVFPLMAENNFGYFFTLALVLIIGINSFVQYYFGISYTVLLNADQRSYIGALLQIVSIILNAILTVFLINLGVNIHVVKLVSTCVFIIKPIALYCYGNKRYLINRKVPRNNESISQKWDNLAQSIASYVHSKTPVVLITLCLNFAEVSVYSVYALITTSLSSVLTGISSGFVSGLGNIYVNKEKGTFSRIFSLYEFINTTATFVFFTMAYLLMIPFVRIYTENMVDAEYIRPMFGLLLILSEMAYCIRLPYFYMITNAGHFKQIKKGAYFEAIFNVVLALCLVKPMGIAGLAIATLIATAYRTVDIIFYCIKHITEQKPVMVLKRLLVNLCSSVCIICVFSRISFEPDSFFGWIILAGMTGIISFVIAGITGILFYKDDCCVLYQRIKNVFGR